MKLITALLLQCVLLCELMRRTGPRFPHGSAGSHGEDMPDGSDRAEQRFLRGLQGILDYSAETAMKRGEDK